MLKKISLFLVLVCLMSGCTSLNPESFDENNTEQGVVVVKPQEEYSDDYFDKSLKIDMISSVGVDRLKSSLNHYNTRLSSRPKNQLAIFRISGNQFVKDKFEELSIYKNEKRLIFDEYIIKTNKDLYVAALFLEPVTDKAMKTYDFVVTYNNNQKSSNKKLVGIRPKEEDSISIGDMSKFLLVSTDTNKIEFFVFGQDIKLAKNDIEIYLEAKDGLNKKLVNNPILYDINKKAIDNINYPGIYTIEFDNDDNLNPTINVKRK